MLVRVGAEWREGQGTRDTGRGRGEAEATLQTDSVASGPHSLSGPLVADASGRVRQRPTQPARERISIAHSSYPSAS